MRIDREEFCVLLEECMYTIKEDYDHETGDKTPIIYRYHAVQTVYRFCLNNEQRAIILKENNCDNIIHGRFTWNNLRAFLALLMNRDRYESNSTVKELKYEEYRVYSRVQRAICVSEAWEKFQANSNYILE